jgi:arsenite methyltransferase
MSVNPVHDAEALRDEVKRKYCEVATNPRGNFHFHTGRFLAARLGYEGALVDTLPEAAIESFAGVANPFSLRPLGVGERVVDVGSGAGLDTFVAAQLVGRTGRVVGVDMTDEMLAKASATAILLGWDQIEFRRGLAESLPVEDDWADVVLSNGVVNLCADKTSVFKEIHRVLRPGGHLQFADIANSRLVPEAAIQKIDLWTAWIAGGLPCAAWKQMLEDVGFVDVVVGRPVDTFEGAAGEKNARLFQVYGYTFLASKRSR